LPARIARVRSDVKNDRTIPTAKTTIARRRRTFGVSKRKNASAEPRRVWGASVLRPPLIATFVGIVAAGILAVGFLFNAVL
jgi:hypothetical protein